MGIDARNEDLTLPPLAKQKFQELLGWLAETEFGPDGPSRDTDFATIERFGHRAGRMLGRAVDMHLLARHAEHFQEGSCPTCEAAGESKALEKEKTRPLQTRDFVPPVREPDEPCLSPYRDWLASRSARRVETSG